MRSSGKQPGRKPFDPRQAKGAPEEAGLFLSGRGPRASATISVSQLNRLVRGAIQKELPGTLYVRGELSNVSQPSGGHVYFTLKDEQSEVRCVMWRSDAAAIKFTLADGLAVVASGSVDVYEPRGQYQLYVRRLEPQGVGALELAFRQLKEKLQKEGLFDPKRKRPLPFLPRRIAVVTSLTGAAIRDILQTIARRCPCVEVFVFGVRVQGEGAAAEIADAIRRINISSERLGGIDVMIVGRGGGSLEDLWAFNEEAVARAIHASTIPIVSAVGHEVDFTIADFVADVRAATPTAAAELVVPVLAELLAEIDGWSHRAAQAMARCADACRARLAVVEKCEWFRDPVGRLRQRQQAIDEATGRLHLALGRAAASRRARLHSLEVRLARIDPTAVLAVRRILWQQLGGRLLRAIDRSLSDRFKAIDGTHARLTGVSHESVLNRGFSITRRAKGGKIVRGPKEVKEGDRLLTQTIGGEFASRVIDAQQAELFE